jgi:predicted nucleotidyltransferase component of viral defense system
MQLTEQEIRKWADKSEIADLTLAELDYRLISALESIYHINGMSTELVMKGGTAINKLYLGDTSRLSVDLDFNQIGDRSKVLSRRAKLRQTLMKALETLDSNYQLSFKRNWSQTTIRARYSSLTGASQQLKLEISHIERIPILDLVTREADTPIGNFNVTTYSLEELLATKLRALFERFSGRDIYDIYFSAKLRRDKELIKKLFLYYFFRSRKIYNPKTHFKTLKERLEQGKYRDDVTGFVRPSTTFSLKDAASVVLDEYSLLAELDEDDANFLAIARSLLRKGQVSKQAQNEIRQIRYPLAALFHAYKITEAATSATRKDIALD